MTSKGLSAADFNPPRTALSLDAARIERKNTRIEVNELTSRSWSAIPAGLRTRALRFWHGPRIERSVTPEFLQSWSLYLKLHPSDVTKELIRDIKGQDRISIWVSKHGQAFYAVELGDKPGSTAIALRTLDFRSQIARHDFLKVCKRGKKGTGDNRDLWATLLNRNAVVLYKQLGIQQVYLNAGLQNGGYVWATRGWLPVNAMEWERVKRQMRRRWNVIRDEVSEDDAKTIEAAFASDDVRHIHQITKTTTIVRETPKHREIKPGNYLLRGTRWIGVLDLQITAQMRVFDEYNNSRLQSYIL